VHVQGLGGAGQQESEQQAKAERHGYPDKTDVGRFPQAFLAT
jgi:hypothetical protein